MSLVNATHCCKESWLARGWHCWTCGRNGNTGTENNWRGPFGRRYLLLENRPGRSDNFRWYMDPDQCDCGVIFSLSTFHGRSTCSSCHSWGIIVLCRFLNDTFGPWCDVHEFVFSRLYVRPMKIWSLRSTSEYHSRLAEDWLNWIRNSYGKLDRG